MRGYFTLTRRELGSYFLSWTAYVVIAVVLLLVGLGFLMVMEQLNRRPSPVPLTEIFTPFFWLIVIPAAPVLTMRLFSQEQATGTLETLMTSPVSDFAVVLAKFSAAFFFYLLMWLPLMAGVYLLRPYLADPTALEGSLLMSTYLGIALIGSVYLAVGTFASALTKSQINAAMVSFCIGVVLFLFGVLALNPPLRSGWPTELFSYISVLTHMQDFARGTVDTRPIVFYLSLLILFLYFTLKVVESRRWK